MEKVHLNSIKCLHALYLDHYAAPDRDCKNCQWPLRQSTLTINLNLDNQNLVVEDTEVQIPEVFF